MLYEIEMDDRFFYARAANADAAARKVKAKFGGHFARAIPTGRVKEKGDADA